MPLLPVFVVDPEHARADAPRRIASVGAARRRLRGTVRDMRGWRSKE